VKCRHCRAELTLPLIDLGCAPPSNAYLSRSALQAPEKWFPLRVLVCATCWLVQTEDYTSADELFDSEYAYFSSTSTSWLRHAEDYTADMTERFALDCNSHVIEVAANDGYLLQYFQRAGVPCLGIEPTASTAATAREKGIEIREVFFGVNVATALASDGRHADLTAANNVLAHVPDINDFVAGFTRILKPQGVSTFEFPHLLKMIAEVQFDTIYHEHFSYLSLTAVNRIFECNGLAIFDVEEISTHGGSLRVFAQRRGIGKRPISDRFLALLAREKELGVATPDFYRDFQARANKIKDDFVAFFIEAKRDGKSVVAYGAAAKGNTLINYAGIRPDLLPWVVDKSPSKAGKFLPGSRIPVVEEERIKAEKPAYIVILPWNLKTEIMAQLSYARKWGARFVTAVPSLSVV